MNNLFTYSGLIKTDEGEELKQGFCFDLNRIIATLPTDKDLKIYLDVMIEEIIPIEYKFKSTVQGKQPNGLGKWEVVRTPFVITLTEQEDIARFYAKIGLQGSSSAA